MNCKTVVWGLDGSFKVMEGIAFNTIPRPHVLVAKDLRIPVEDELFQRIPLALQPCPLDGQGFTDTCRFCGVGVEEAVIRKPSGQVVEIGGKKVALSEATFKHGEVMRVTPIMVAHVAIRQGRPWVLEEKKRDLWRMAVKVQVPAANAHVEITPPKTADPRMEELNKRAMAATYDYAGKTIAKAMEAVFVVRPGDRFVLSRRSWENLEKKELEVMVGRNFELLAQIRKPQTKEAIRV